MIRAVIFDLDGTLVDSEELVLGAFQHVLNKHGQVYDVAAVKTHVGRLLEHTYMTLVPGHDPKKLADLHRDWQIDKKHLFKGFEGTDEFLEQLRKSGLKLGAYTSASRLRTDAMLDVTGLDKYLSVIVCGDEVTNPKPHQEGVERVAEVLQVNLDEVVFVGDAEHDILSGKNAGVITVGITHGFGTKESLTSAGADYMVNNLHELLVKLKEIGSK